MTPAIPDGLTHPLLEQAGVRHGFFTRLGGVSTGLYASLNTGIGSDDDANAVMENRRRIAEIMGGTPETLAACYQVHSATTHIATKPWRSERPEGDAVVTAIPGIVCAVLTADCAPVLLADAEVGVVGAVHAGWKGALGGIVESAVAAMQTLGADPARIVAVIGPTIGQASYEVDAAFRQRLLDESPDNHRFFIVGIAPDKYQFDLPAYVLSRLARAGVTNAAWTGHDTCADSARFFSNRRTYKASEPDFGRMMSVIRL